MMKAARTALENWFEGEQALQALADEEQEALQAVRERFVERRWELEARQAITATTAQRAFEDAGLAWDPGRYRRRD